MTTTDGQGSTQPVDDFGWAGAGIEWDDPRAKAIEHALYEIGLDLRKLGHAHAHLDANARVYISRHLVGRGIEPNDRWRDRNTRLGDELVGWLNEREKVIAERDEALRLGQALAAALQAWGEDSGTFTGEYTLDPYEQAAIASLREWREWQDARQ